MGLHHGHEHEHEHEHGHERARPDLNRAFAVGIGLNLAFVVVEASYGLAAGSLALLADAGHNLSDVLGLGLAWVASVLARRKPSPQFTYGLRRSSILAALLNAIFLLVATGGIGWEAMRRFGEPEPVAGGTMIAVAAVGVVINAVSALFFEAGHRHDLNLKAAFWHLVADAAVSLGVVLAGVAILATGWNWLDPAISLVVAGVILWGTWELLRDSLVLALDGVPVGIDAHAISAYLEALPGVVAIHDLHIWGMSTTESALTVHLVMPAASGSDAFLAEVQAQLHERFGIGHTTIQIESGDAAYACQLDSRYGH